MRLAHFGHACLLAEWPGTRVLVDPGTLCSGFEDLRDLDAVLVTHAHPDHLDTARLPALLAANPRAQLVVDRGSAPLLREIGVDLRVVDAGDRLRLGGVSLEVVGGEHAVVHADVPTVPNCGYLLDGGALYHPGDSLVVPEHDVDVFAAPVDGPWIRLGEAVDLARAVGARVSVPVHEAGLADTALTHSVMARLAGPYAVLPRGELSTV